MSKYDEFLKLSNRESAIDTTTTLKLGHSVQIYEKWNKLVIADARDEKNVFVTIILVNNERIDPHNVVFRNTLAKKLRYAPNSTYGIYSREYRHKDLRIKESWHQMKGRSRRKAKLRVSPGNVVEFLMFMLIETRIELDDTFTDILNIILTRVPTNSLRDATTSDGISLLDVAFRYPKLLMILSTIPNLDQLFPMAKPKTLEYKTMLNAIDVCVFREVKYIGEYCELFQKFIVQELNKEHNIPRDLNAIILSFVTIDYALTHVRSRNSTSFEMLMRASNIIWNKYGM